ncbi:MAG: hypothetical protein ACFFEE_04130 [Candidatus Thorarchaeota archaeon]
MKLKRSNKLISMFLIISLVLLSSVSTKCIAIPDDIIIVDTSAISEGDGDTYSFPYELNEGTIIEWSLQSDSAETLFDFLVFNDIDNPFSSSIVEIYDTTDNSSFITVPTKGIWYLHVRHSRFHGDYNLHVTGWINQSGTILPSITSTPSITDTNPTQTSSNGSLDDRSWIFPLLVGILIVTVVVMGYLWKKYT